MRIHDWQVNLMHCPVLTTTSSAYLPKRHCRINRVHTWILAVQVHYNHWRIWLLRPGCILYPSNSWQQTYFIFTCVRLEVEPRSLHILGKHSFIEYLLSPQTIVWLLELHIYEIYNKDLEINCVFTPSLSILYEDLKIWWNKIIRNINKRSF